ncbi:MAG: glycosyltransferase, partial [Gemmatimonadaceae bacterium]|nr:glycosyltransferase [Gemmatimonadaceae bacterium]
MLYLAIPAHNEVATIGVLLWRLRTVLAEFPREYEVVVYDDASTDDTAAVAEQYAHAMPVTVLRGAAPIGYAGSVNTLIRYVAGHTRYPRRDAMLLLQGDFTDPPGIVPEFARRFEGGADLVVGERTAVVDAPVPVKRLFTAAAWALKPFVRVPGVRDLTSSMRLVRISALRDLLRTVGEQPICEGDSWTANADLLLRLVPHARRIETVPLEPTYGVRTRESRRVTVRDALAALRWGWRARGRRVEASTAPESAVDAPTRGARGTGARRDEPELTVDKLRERSKDRDRLRGDVAEPPSRRDGRQDRERSRGARSDENRRPDVRDGARAEGVDAPRESTRAESRSDGRSSRGDTQRSEPARPPRTERPPRAEPAERAERPERGDRTRRSRPTAPTLDADLILDDPFAAPAAKRASAALTPVALPTARTETPTEPEPAADTLDADAAAAMEASTPITSDDASREGIARTPRDRTTETRFRTAPSNETAEKAADASDSEVDEDDDALDAADVSADSADDTDAEVDGESGEARRERKRRRNRRSRRRKSKSRETGSPDAEPS